MSIGKYFGIEVNIHWIWLIALALLGLGGSFGPALLSVVVTLILFFIVLLHEFGHALTAKKLGFKADKITLMVLGGVAWIGENKNNTWWKSFLVAAGGPAVNLVIGVMMAIVSHKIGFVNFEEFTTGLSDGTALSTLGVVEYTWYMVYLCNIVLLLFNLLPIFPLDGGQICQSLFWGLLTLIGVKKPENISVMVFSCIGMLAGCAGAVFFVMNLAIFMTIICGFIFLTCLAYYDNHYRQYYRLSS